MSKAEPRVVQATGLRLKILGFRRALFGQSSMGRYGAIGLTGVGLDFIIFAVLIFGGVPPVTATVLGTLFGITNNYILNAVLNFRFRLNLPHGAKFLTVGLLGLGLSVLIVATITSLGQTAVVAKIISIGIVVTAQFVANKYWTFGFRRYAGPSESAS